MTKIDVSGTLSSIPGMDEDALLRLDANVADWLQSKTPARVEAAQTVGSEVAAERARRMARRDAEWQETLERARSLSAADRVEMAFRKFPPSEIETKAIRLLLDNPGSTSTELSSAGGWNGMIWQTFFGQACKLREPLLWPAAYVPARDGHFYSGILADLEEPANRFTMKPEACEGLCKAGLAAGEKS